MSTPYYQDEQDRTCECGCGTPVARRYVSGHNRKGQTTPLERRYWLVKVREGGGRWDKEHILVAEREAGRKLRDGEHVHHINCVRDDNRPQNLIILPAADHARAHGSLNQLVASLIQDGHIVFDREAGAYRRG